MFVSISSGTAARNGIQMLRLPRAAAQVFARVSAHGSVIYDYIFKAMILRFSICARLNVGFQKHDLKNELVTGAISDASKSYVFFVGAGFEGQKWGWAHSPKYSLLMFLNGIW